MRHDKGDGDEVQTDEAHLMSWSKRKGDEGKKIDETRTKRTDREVGIPAGRETGPTELEGCE